MRSGQDGVRRSVCDDRVVVVQDEVVAEKRSEAPAIDREIGESRWPPALALLVFMSLNIALRVWLPNGQSRQGGVADSRH
jgi:hypothetical protein